VVNRDEQSRGAGRKGDTERAVVGGRDTGFPYPAAQQVLDGRSVGCGAWVGVGEEIEVGGVGVLDGCRAPLLGDAFLWGEPVLLRQPLSWLAGRPVVQGG
jgi:hypothetical protein